MGRSRSFSARTVTGMWQSMRDTYDLGDTYEPLVWCNKFNCWVANSNQVVRDVLQRTDIFLYSREVGGFNEPYHSDPRIRRIHDNGITATNGEAHRVLQAFFRQQIGAVLPHVPALVADASHALLSEGLAHKSQIDLFRDWTLPLSQYVLSTISGLPYPWPRVLEQVREVTAMVWDPYVTEDETRITKNCFLELLSFLDDYREHAQDQFTWGVLHAETPELVESLPSNVWAAIFGATHTAPIAICDSLSILWEYYQHDRAQYEAIVDSSESLALFVNEVLRLIPPGTVTYRYPREDTSLHGKPLKQGDVVVINYVYANRDEAVWEAPHELRPRRQPNPHLSFSAGPHTCAGAQLGLAETVAGISWFIPNFAVLSTMALSPRPPKYSLEATWNGAPTLRAPDRFIEAAHQPSACPHSRLGVSVG